MLAPDLVLVESFVALADELHFGRAARRLGIAPPVLSQRISRLERQLGVKLAVRPSRAIALTAAGEVFLPSAREAMTAIDGAVIAARAANREHRHQVRLGWTADSEIMLRPVVHAASIAQRGYELSFHGLIEASLLAGILDRTLDLVFLFGPGPDRDDSLRLEPLLLAENGVAVRSQHPLASRGTVTAGQLAGDPLVLFPREADAWVYDILVGVCRPAGAAPGVRTAALETYGAQASMMDSVAADGGFCPVTRHIFDRTHPPGLSYLSLEPPFLATMTAVFRRDEEDLVGPLVDLLRSAVLEHPERLPAGCSPLQPAVVISETMP